MAISDKLTKLSTDITNAYNSIQEKGGTIPTNKNTENLSSSISSIKSYEDEYLKLISDRKDNYNPTNLPSEITKIDQYAFAGCTNLVLTSLSDKLGYIGSYAFSGCTKLALTSLPDNIRNIGSYAFNNCKNLALTSLPQNLLYINNNVFNKCRSLKITELPVSCTKIYSYGLSGCTGITELTLPETFTRLYNAALSDCTNLTTLKILASTPPEIDSTTAFRNCPKLTRIEVPSASLEAYKTAKIWSNYANIMVGV